MSDINTVTLTGNLTADPELRYSPAGKAFAGFTVATNRKWKAQTGELKEDTSFIGCTAFGQQAEFIGQYFRKGQPVLIQGRLNQDTWEDRDTGKKQSKTKIIVEVVKSIGGKREQSEERPAQQPTQAVDASSSPRRPVTEDDVPF